MFERPPFGNGCSYSVKIMASRSPSWHDLPTDFHKSIPVISEDDKGDRQTHTDKKVISLAHIFPSGREVG
jgi:hypothetical protein